MRSSIQKAALFSIVAAVFSPTAIFADDGFDITIVAGKDASSSSVKVSGKVSEVITDADRTAFNIEDSDLKKAVDAYFGKKPNDAYVKSKTPWGDLYDKYSWTQVHRNIKVHSARIVDVTSEPTIISKKTLTNNSNVAATLETSISESVSNSTESNWSEEDSFTVGQSFSYDVSFLGSGGGGETSLEYTHTWGEGGSESQDISVGSEQSVSVYLEPGQSVEAQLNASRGSLKVEIVYEIYLSGTTAINYNPKYKGHHFWDLGVSGVMKSGKITNSYLVSETIEVGYYSDGEVVLGSVQ